MSGKSSKATKSVGDKVIIVLAFTLIISVMNVTMFNVALPAISEEFQLTASEVSWVVTTFIIIYAVGSVLYGKLADKYQLKNIITVGLVLFAAGSLVGLTAVNYPMVVIGRALQGLGASVIPAISMIIPIRYFPPETRGRAFGISYGGLAFGTAIGPVVAGVLTGLADWRYLFGLSLIALIAIPFYRNYLETDTLEKRKTDIIGAVLLSASITFILLSLSTESIFFFFLGAISILFFYVRIRKAKEPFIRLEIFKNRRYSIGLVIFFITMAFSYSVPFIIPQMFNYSYGLSAVTIGLLMSPGAIIAALIGKKGGSLADKKGNEILVLIAMSCFLISFLSVSIFAGTSALFIMLMITFGYIGHTYMMIGMSNTVSQTISQQYIGVGMGLFSMFNFMGVATATTIYGKVLDTSTSLLLNPFAFEKQAALYSNIFIVLAGGVLLNMLFFYYVFMKGQREYGNVRATNKSRSK